MLEFQRKGSQGHILRHRHCCYRGQVARWVPQVPFVICCVKSKLVTCKHRTRSQLGTLGHRFPKSQMTQGATNKDQSLLLFLQCQKQALGSIPTLMCSKFWPSINYLDPPELRNSRSKKIWKTFCQMRAPPQWSHYVAWAGLSSASLNGIHTRLEGLARYSFCFLITWETGNLEEQQTHLYHLLATWIFKNQRKQRINEEGHSGAGAGVS